MFTLPIPASTSLLSRYSQPDTSSTADFITLNIARELSVAPKIAARQICVRVGEWVTARSVVAEYLAPHGKIEFQRVYAPCAGTVRSVQGALVMIVPFNRSIPLPKQASQPSQPSLTAAWGVGENISAELVLLSLERNAALTPSLVRPEHAGKLLAVGGALTARGLQAALAVGAQGVLVGSVEAELLPLCHAVNLPILVLEGFGKCAIDPANWMTLYLNNRALTKLEFSAQQKPKVLFSHQLPTRQNTPMQTATQAPDVRLSAGMRVKLTRGQSSGQVGVLQKVISSLHTFPSGLRSRAALVRLLHGEEIIAPLNNLLAV